MRQSEIETERERERVSERKRERERDRMNLQGVPDLGLGLDPRVDTCHLRPILRAFAFKIQGSECGV